MTGPTPRLAPPSPDLIRRLIDIVGPEHALTDPILQQPFLMEWRDRYVGLSPLVLRPGTIEEVSRIMALVNEAGVGIVPQAGNTGLVGGQIPHESGTEIVLSVSRLKKVRHVDPAGTAMIVEAGLTLAEAQAAAANAGRLFPLSMASEGSCQIGGNLATNAGGVAVLAYGNARNLVLGLEVVLADGRVWDGLRTLKKDNTGYDLKDLFIGSEGTLGIITAAALKLFPRPAETATAFVAIRDTWQLLDLYLLAQARAGQSLTAFEFMPQLGLEFVSRHISGTRMPFAPEEPWYALLEISGAQADGSAETKLEGLLIEAADSGLISATAFARSLTQAADLWHLREALSEAQKPEGGSIKHDVSVPIPLIPEFITRANKLVEDICPGARPVPFGHLGDGNVHYNVSQPAAASKASFLALWEPMSEAVHGLVTEMGGSISAEHGIGRMKRKELVRRKSSVEIDLMRRIKAAFDPKGVLNPGKLL